MAEGFRKGLHGQYQARKMAATLVEGDENICSITYKELPQDLTPGARVLLDDGLVGMKVDAIQATTLSAPCRTAARSPTIRA